MISHNPPCAPLLGILCFQRPKKWQWGQNDYHMNIHALSFEIDLLSVMFPEVIQVVKLIGSILMLCMVVLVKIVHLASWEDTQFRVFLFLEWEFAIY